MSIAVQGDEFKLILNFFFSYTPLYSLPLIAHLFSYTFFSFPLLCCRNHLIYTLCTVEIESCCWLVKRTRAHWTFVLLSGWFFLLPKAKLALINVHQGLFFLLNHKQAIQEYHAILIDVFYFIANAHAHSQVKNTQLKIEREQKITFRIHTKIGRLRGAKCSGPKTSARKINRQIFLSEMISKPISVQIQCVCGIKWHGEGRTRKTTRKTNSKNINQSFYPKALCVRISEYTLHWSAIDSVNGKIINCLLLNVSPPPFR